MCKFSIQNHFGAILEVWDILKTIWVMEIGKVILGMIWSTVNKAILVLSFHFGCSFYQSYFLIFIWFYLSRFKRIISSKVVLLIGYLCLFYHKSCLLCVKWANCFNFLLFHPKRINSSEISYKLVSQFCSQGWI